MKIPARFTALTAATLTGLSLTAVGTVVTATPASAGHRTMADCPTLWPGTVQTQPGSCVRRLQRLMDEAGIPTVVDGRYGPGTVASVKTVERRYAIRPVNGIAGNDVQDILEIAHDNA